MIYRNGRLVTAIDTYLKEAKVKTKLVIGRVYLGTELVWVTIRDAIRSCYGSGIWLKDKNWINDDTWKNN